MHVQFIYKHTCLHTLIFFSKKLYYNHTSLVWSIACYFNQTKWKIYIECLTKKAIKRKRRGDFPRKFSLSRNLPLCRRLLFPFLSFIHPIRHYHSLHIQQPIQQCKIAIFFTFSFTLPFRYNVLLHIIFKHVSVALLLSFSISRKNRLRGDAQYMARRIRVLCRV